MIFSWDFKLNFEVEVWSWSFNFEVEIWSWTWCLMLKFEVKVWSWDLKAKFKCEVQIWHLKLTLTWSWQLKLACEVDFDFDARRWSWKLKFKDKAWSLSWKLQLRFEVLFECLKGPCHVGKTFDMLKQHVSVFQIYIFYFEIPPGTPLKLEKTANFSVEKWLKWRQWLQKNQSIHVNDSKIWKKLMSMTTQI